jgi:hypothetical protein
VAAAPAPNHWEQELRKILQRLPPIAQFGAMEPIVAVDPMMLARTLAQNVPSPITSAPRQDFRRAGPKAGQC